MLVSDYKKRCSRYLCDKCGEESAERPLYLHGPNYVHGGYRASSWEIRDVAEPAECHGFVSVVKGNRQVHHCLKCAGRS